MAVLTEQQRAELYAEISDALSRAREPVPVLKTELRAAIDAADNWANANAAGYNSALPQPFRGAATADQKSRLLERVVAFRRRVGA